MSDGTKISYVDATWNPVMGCTPVSEGCKYCYAARLAKLHRWDFNPHIVTNALDLPLHWNNPRRILVPSMGDLLHPAISDKELLQILTILFDCKQHQFLFLTKRIERWARQFAGWKTQLLPDNLYLGITAENQKYLDSRLPQLLKIHATYYWLSLEPLLSAIFIPPKLLKKISYVVVGCETGPGHRPCNLVWIYDIVRQCKTAGVRCHVKQISLNGKILHNPAEWPKDLRYRDLIPVAI